MNFFQNNEHAVYIYNRLFIQHRRNCDCALQQCSEELCNIIAQQSYLSKHKFLSFTEITHNYIFVGYISFNL
jgi:hypothetical protein